MHSVEQQIIYVPAFENPFAGLAPEISQEEQTLEQLKALLSYNITMLEKIYDEYANGYGRLYNIPEVTKMYHGSTFYNKGHPEKTYAYIKNLAGDVYELLNRKIFEYFGLNPAFKARFPMLTSNLGDVYEKEFRTYYNKIENNYFDTYGRRLYITDEHVINSSRKLLKMFKEFLAVAEKY